MSDQDDFGSFLLGFIIGGLTGAAVALLLAPQSGDKTRAMIREKSIELRDKAADTVEEAYTIAEEAAAEARVRAEELAQQARVRAEDFQKKGKVLLEEQKDRITDVVTAAKKATSKPAGPKAADEKPAA